MAVREFRCCMCPNINEPDNPRCPTQPPTPCTFVRTYIDYRGWKYRVMGGLGESNYKARYCKPDKDRWHCLKVLPWRNSFDEAQTDLNTYAKSKGWKEAS